jgi:Opacity family porin protein
VSVNINFINLAVSLKMKVFSGIQTVAILLVTLTSSLLVASAGRAEERKYDAGLAVQFGDSTSVGIQGRVGVADNISIRPEIFFNSSSTLGNRQFGSIPAGAIQRNASGPSFGVAATYDLKLDPQGQSTAYIGPKVSVSSLSSDPFTFQGADYQLKLDETKIGLVAGVDYAVSNDFLVGANITYNLSRSLSVSNGNGGRTDLNNIIQSSGNSVDFGVRASYRF